MFRGANTERSASANRISLLTVELVGIQALLFAIFGYPALVRLLERL